MHPLALNPWQSEWSWIIYCAAASSRETNFSIVIIGVSSFCSDTTAQEVIRALLQKFRITDNPRKFALYERLNEDDGKSEWTF